MPRSTSSPEPDLFDLLDEQENGPKPCPHRFTAGKFGSAWVHETNPHSDYYLEWVHADPRCRRSAVPGKTKQPLPTMGWSRELQKDVPL